MPPNTRQNELETTRHNRTEQQGRKPFPKDTDDTIPAGNKRKLSTREREDRGRGNRGGRGGNKRNYGDNLDGPPHRRGTRRDDEAYPSRTFEQSKRGGRGPRTREDRGRKREVEPVKPVYQDLDDIDSQSDWEEEEGGDTVVGVAKVEQEGRNSRGHNRRDYNHRGRGQDRSRRGRYPRRGYDEEYSRPHPPARNKQEEHDDVDTPTDPPTKGHDFTKYDINAHNVVVVDRRGSHSDLEGVVDEGFIEVRSKRDKHKEREDKRRTDGPQQKKELDGATRQKGSSSRSQDHTHTGKGWGQVHHKKAEPLAREGNEEWPLNEGRSAYGAIGDKPSKEKGCGLTDSQKMNDASNNPGYKLFDKGKTDPFSFDPLPNSPRKGDRLRAAIEITLPTQIAPHFDTDRLVPGGQTPPTDTGPTSSVKSTNEVQAKSKEHQVKSGDEPRPHGGKGATDRNRGRKPKVSGKCFDWSIFMFYL